MVGDSATAADYGDPMSERLLGLAADVLRSFGSAFGGRHLAIVGGAAPSLLVNHVPTGIEAHVGTADLDFHLSLHLLDGETADYYQAIIDGLRYLGLRADRVDGRPVKWRWIGTHRGVQLQVEFLCPVRTSGVDQKVRRPTLQPKQTSDRVGRSPHSQWGTVTSSQRTRSLLSGESRPAEDC